MKIEQETRQRSDDDLIARCRQGDRAAWRELYDQHFQTVYFTARRLGTPPAELEDVAQEVFGIAFQKLDHFSGGQLGGWLYRICANVVLDHHRKRRVRAAFSWLLGAEPMDERPAPGPSPEGLVARREAQERVYEILQRMSVKRREVFALFEIEGLSGEEISSRLGCSVQTVWTRLHHARKDFARIGRKRQLLDGPFGD